MDMLLICYQETINKLIWIFNKFSKGSGIGDQKPIKQIIGPLTCHGLDPFGVFIYR